MKHQMRSRPDAQARQLEDLENGHQLKYDPAYLSRQEPIPDMRFLCQHLFPDTLLKIINCLSHANFLF